MSAKPTTGSRPDFRQLRALPRERWPRREQILFEAASQFAQRGYHGTSTRDIADALGIRQPSLYNHYPSKLAILEDLCAYDIGVPGERARWISRVDAPASARLYAAVRLDVEYCLEAPIDMRGLPDDLIGEPGLETWNRKLRAWYATVRAIVREGVEAGELAPIDPEFARQAIWGVEWEVIRVSHGGRRRRAGTRPDDVASFVLRGLLADPSRVGEAREAAAGVIAAYRAAHPG
ncbi:TetR/AcrR family transcriptional regulator [Microtetraspora niveoalba]|uniref:TetR/AcrR family transcriptional regulator n=1 Tax=Microtetraspora niveoalba TaxID=46175 RepID=UPI0008377881|nr:TetR/AcrR family transcriptional regulator [Microtetraspora niveoalba]